jgi:hypothetical protein
MENNLSFKSAKLLIKTSLNWQPDIQMRKQLPQAEQDQTFFSLEDWKELVNVSTYQSEWNAMTSR